ncbi:MAG: HD domain-containing protein [Candidatus Methanofastidiosia archaeon]
MNPVQIPGLKGGVTMNEEYLRKTFPQIDLIKDPDLKKKVISTFLKTAQNGGWDTLEGIPFTLLTDTSVTFAEHTKAVTDMAIQCAEVMKNFVHITPDYVVAGGLLHDVGKLLEYQKKEGKITQSRYGALLRHPVSGAVIAAEVGLPPEIIHIIVAHSKEGDAVKRIPEAIIIHHCDFVHFESLKK